MIRKGCKIYLLILCQTFLYACANSAYPFVMGDSDIYTDSNPVVLSPYEAFHFGHNILGFWQIALDSDRVNYAVMPDRGVNIHLNVIGWLEVNPCTDCLNITKIVKDPFNNLLVDIQIRHPFIAENLTGFDVRGIAMFDGSVSFPLFGLISSSIFQGDVSLDKADGYTTLYNPATAGNGFMGFQPGKLAEKCKIPNSTLNGYMTYYSDGDRNYFSASDTITRTYTILKPASVKIINFGYAIDVSWAKPSSPVNVPDSFPITANSIEAYRIDADYDYPLTTAKDSISTLTIDVYDWQGENTVSSAIVEGPFFWAGIKTAYEIPGGPGEKRFEVELVNEYGAVPAGQYPVAICILDTESTPGQIIDRIAWDIVNITVVVNHTPVCLAQVDTLDPNAGQMVTFTDASTDEEGVGTIEESWWDWENDGIIDEQGWLVEHVWQNPGTYYINHMVIDQCGAYDWLDQPIKMIVK